MPNYFNPYQQQPYYNQQPTMQAQPQPQIQNGGFVSVRSEMEARTYPVAPGNSITFKDENSPYVYTKTMGFSQLDRPIFEKYKLVKEDITEPTEQQAIDNNEMKNMKSDIEKLWGEVDALKKQIHEPPRKSTTHKDKDGGDD